MIGTKAAGFLCDPILMNWCCMWGNGDWGRLALLGACYKVGLWCLVCLGCRESCRDSWCHFEDCERTFPVLNYYFFHTLYEGVGVLGLFSISSLVELIALCTFPGSFYRPTVYF